MTPEQQRELRNAFGSFMTGVTVVTTRSELGEPVGFTANSFSSVSLDPPLLLVCPSMGMSSYTEFKECKHFCINILSSDQREVSNTFAGASEDRFSKVDWQDNDQGIPRLANTIAYFDCQQYDFHEAGDHGILIGKVMSFADLGGHGLGYHRGGYFSLDMEREAYLRATQDTDIRAGVIAKHSGGILMQTEQDQKSKVLPSVTVKSDECAYSKIETLLDERYNLSVDAGEVYSVFKNDAGKTTIYYRVDCKQDSDSPNTSAQQWLAMEDVVNSEFRFEYEATMLQRFVQENRTGNHRLYIGDDQSGVVQKVSRSAKQV